MRSERCILSLLTQRFQIFLCIALRKNSLKKSSLPKTVGPTKKLKRLIEETEHGILFKGKSSLQIVANSTESECELKMRSFEQRTRENPSQLNEIPISFPVPLLHHCSLTFKVKAKSGAIKPN